MAAEPPWVFPIMIHEAHVGNASIATLTQKSASPPPLPRPIVKIGLDTKNRISAGCLRVMQTDHRARWLSTCVMPHERSLRRWLEQKRMRGIDVDDIIQDTYVTLVRLESVDGIRNPKAYVYQMAYSLALVCLRRSRVISFQAVANFDEIPGQSAPSAEDLVSGHEELIRVAAVLDGLPHRCREVFVLRKIHGLSQREVAAQMAITEGTVEKQMHKALQRLVELLGRGRKSVARASSVRTATEQCTEFENKGVAE